MALYNATCFDPEGIIFRQFVQKKTPLKHTSSTGFALYVIEIPLKKHDKLFIIL